MSEKTGLLIETVRSYPVLYDPSHEEFRNLKYKNNIWGEIAILIGDANGDATKAKWRNLRDCYGKHLRSKTNAASKHTARYKSWPWVQEMSFLEPFIEAPNSYQNGTDSDNKTTLESQAQPSKKHSEHHYRSTKKILKRNRDQSEWQMDRVLEFLNSTNSSDCDGVDLVFLGYARIIKKFSPFRQAIVKYEIAKIIMEAELEHAKEMSQVSVEIIGSDAERCDSPADYIDPPEVKLETEDSSRSYDA